MKRIYNLSALVLALIVLGGLSSCMMRCVNGSGNITSESRTTGDFSKISIQGGFRVVLKQDSSTDLKITADDNLIKYIVTDISDGTLRIYSKRSLCNTGQMMIVVGFKSIDEIKGSGAVDIEGQGKVIAKDIKFKMSGATKIALDLTAANVTTESAGATDIYLKGQATSHTLDLSGVAHVYAFDFVTGAYNIHTTGAGQCEVNVLNSLKVHSTGASDVKYKGNPTTVENDKTGAGSVEKVN